MSCPPARPSTRPATIPAASAIIIQLQQSLNAQQTYNDTINSATAQLSQTDSSLGNLTTLLQQAEQIASADVGSDVVANPAHQRRQRRSKPLQPGACHRQPAIQRAISLRRRHRKHAAVRRKQRRRRVRRKRANPAKQYQQRNLAFTSRPAARRSSDRSASGVNGSANITPIVVGDHKTFRSRRGRQRRHSTRVHHGRQRDRDQNVDLSSAASVGDVVNLINQAAVGGITASITGQGLTITGAPTDNITIGGSTAAATGNRHACRRRGTRDAGRRSVPQSDR